MILIQYLLDYVIEKIVQAETRIFEHIQVMFIYMVGVKFHKTMIMCICE